MRVLLVYPNVRGMNMLPPAIALFSTLLKAQGHSVCLFDSTDYPNPEFFFDSDKEKEKNLNARPFDDALLRKSFVEEDVFDAFVRIVDEFQPELMALSVTEDMYPVGMSLLKHTADRKIPTIMGGVFPTFAPDKVIANAEVDMVCVGEGEHVLTTLCDRMENGKSYDDIPGLWVKERDGRVKPNAMGPAIEIDSNPILDLSIFADGRLYKPMQGKVWRMFPLETHRGCPYQCAYCNSPSQWQLYRENTPTNHFRKKSPDKIREEILVFRDQYQAEAFYFWADTFFAYSSKEFDAFIEMYAEFKIPFWCQTRPETVTRERIQQLKDIGLFRMAFGVEHGNAEFRRKHIRRECSNEKIIKALNIVHEVGVPFSVNNILGFPYETRELTFDTVELNRQFKADSINAYSFSPFHGTPLRTIAEQEGYIDPDLIARSIMRPTMLNMPQYPPDQIEGMRRCFTIYVKLPKNRWHEVEQAEKLTPEGDRIWQELRDEIGAVAFDDDAGNDVVNFEQMAMGATE
jgi:anaerobic magnesium-protoporphyrin IX monomethyl ester cyclase